MTASIFAVLFFLCWAALLIRLREWGREKRRATAEKRAACAQAGHPDGWRHFFAFDDPRYPVRECKGCGQQDHLQPPVPCPHCGEDVRTPPGQEQAVRLSV